MKTYFLLVAFSSGVINLLAQPTPAEYQRRIDLLQQNIKNVFYDSAAQYYKEFNRRDSNDKKPDSYLWPLCALIQAANETEALQLSQISFKAVLKSIGDYYDPAPPLPAYNAAIVKIKKEERFYDDNQWIAIACLDAYERTRDTILLKEGKQLYDFMMTGYDTVTGGGLYWKENDFSTKNTCSNGPGIIVALQLYKATRQKKYLQTALQLLQWTDRFLLAPEGVYYDHIKLPSRKIDNRTYTYNTGTMLQANVLLYEITKNRKYLIQANRLASAAYTHFFKNGRFPNHAWFNAVLLRGYLALYRYNKTPVYIAAFIKDTETIWQTERDENNLIGTKSKKELIEQAAMLEIYARLLQFVTNNNKKN